MGTITGSSSLRLALLESTMFLGPAMIIAVQMSGKSYTHFFQAGGEFGPVLLWVVGLSLLFKFTLVDGLARYTLWRGESVFSGLIRLPGPRNWGPWVVTAVYTLELAIYASMILLAATMLQDLLPWTIPVDLIAILGLALILLVLIRRSLGALERTVYVIIGVVGGIMAYCTVAAFMNPTPGNFGVIPDQLNIDALYLLASGSGLSLLLYSIWVSDKAKNVTAPEDFPRQMRGIRGGLAIAFLLTGLITFGIVIIAWVSGPGEEMTAVGTGLAALPLAPTAFLFAVSILMFGVVLIGIDGRARAISKMLRQTNTTKIDRPRLYRMLVVTFALIITIALGIGRPGNVLNLIAGMSAALFALTGFALVYLNHKMPEYARAGLAWTGLTMVGSAFFLAIALLEERTIIEFGVPLLIRLGLVALLLYAMLRYGALAWLVRNIKHWKGAAAGIALFSAISVFGTVAGIDFNGAIVNFRDLGAMMAGLLGGPIIGGLTGLIGGAYRYGLGGWTALPCFVATVSGGIVAGLLAAYWKGRISYLKVMFLGVLVECMHLFLYFPLLVWGAPASDVLEVIRTMTIPMTLTNVVGLILFVYILEMRKLSTRTAIVPLAHAGADGSAEVDVPD